MIEQPEYHAWRKQFIAERGRPPTAYEAWVAATRAQPQADAAEPVARDAQRLDYLQTRGATVEILSNGPRWCFRIGGLRDTVSRDVRSAIDAAIAAQAPGARGEGAIPSGGTDRCL